MNQSPETSADATFCRKSKKLRGCAFELNYPTVMVFLLVQVIKLLLNIINLLYIPQKITA